jgi:6,7-dimethyl-8-ribityllumazine synthase
VSIAIARFNNIINDSLMKGSIYSQKRIGKVADDNITVVWVTVDY